MKMYCSWQEFSFAVNELEEKIKKSKYKFDGIYGIPRGGVILAVCLASRLNLPLLMFPTKNTLVVDDISDTGETLTKFKNKKIITLYSTKWTITKPYWYVFEKTSKKDWIVFPWELADE